MVTRGQFAEQLLPLLDAPVTQRNLWALVSWMQAEGGNARFNPLNTTKKMPGSTDYNWVGVQNYTSLQQGLEATAETLNYGADRDLYGYKPIRRRLRRTAFARDILRAVEESQWGTGGLALRCLRFVKRNYQAYSAKPIGQ